MDSDLEDQDELEQPQPKKKQQVKPPAKTSTAVPRKGESVRNCLPPTHEILLAPPSHSHSLSLLSLTYPPLASLLLVMSFMLPSPLVITHCLFSLIAFRHFHSHTHIHLTHI